MITETHSICSMKFLEGFYSKNRKFCSSCREMKEYQRKLYRNKIDKLIAERFGIYTNLI